MKEKGLLIVVSGPAGCGKSTVLKALTEKRENLRFSISVTTRSPRLGEQNGREYFFINKEEFERMVQEDQLLEYAHYTDHWYGTPQRQVEEMLENGMDVYLDIEVQGAGIIRRKCPSALFIFLMPPSMEELERRLRGRGTETEVSIQKRLERAQGECAVRERFDYVVVNDTVARAAEEISSLIDRKKAELLAQA